MKRDTVTAYRARAKQADTWIADGLAAQKAEWDANWKATQEAHRKAEAERIRFTRDDLLTATLIRTAYGVHKVVRVNQKTVTVATEYSWTETIAFDKVLEWSSAVMV